MGYLFVKNLGELFKMEKKTKFLRNEGTKKIRLGRGVRKNQKWRKAKGRHSKIRLGIKGKGRRPKIGYSAGGIRNSDRIVFNVGGLEGVKKGEKILIGKIGLKKRKGIVEEAGKKGIKILNRYEKIKEDKK